MLLPMIFLIEIENILMGNHYASLESVKKKANTIMNQAKRAGGKSINFSEFLVVSEKV